MSWRSITRTKQILISQATQCHNTWRSEKIFCVSGHRVHSECYKGDMETPKARRTFARVSGVNRSCEILLSSCLVRANVVCDRLIGCYIISTPTSKLAITTQHTIWRPIKLSEWLRKMFLYISQKFQLVLYKIEAGKSNLSLSRTIDGERPLL